MIVIVKRLGGGFGLTFVMTIRWVSNKEGAL